MAELTGSWLGSYWDRQAPIRFEVTFVQAQNSLSGRIMDDSPLGEAQLQGQVVGRQVTFTKRYFNNPSYTIQYQGTVSEDGVISTASGPLIPGITVLGKPTAMTTI